MVKGMDKIKKIKDYFGDDVNVEEVTERGMEVEMPREKAKEIGAEIKEERADGNVLAAIRYFKAEGSDKRVIDPLEQFQSKQKPSAPESDIPGGTTLE